MSLESDGDLEEVEIPLEREEVRASSSTKPSILSFWSASRDEKKSRQIGFDKRVARATQPHLLKFSSSLVISSVGSGID